MAAEVSYTDNIKLDLVSINALPSRIAIALEQLTASEPPYQLDGFRLQIKEAQQVCNLLRDRTGLSLQPYDIKKTINVWKSSDENGIPYTQKATKELIVKLAHDTNTDFRTLDGFKVLLAHLRVDTFRNYEINQNKTTLSGVLDYYHSSPSAPILELIKNDPEFKQIKDYGITGADFPEAPNYYWKDKNGNPTTNSVELFTRYALRVISKYDWQNKDANSIVELYQILAKTSETNSPLNHWGTTINSAILHGFGGSLIKATLSFIISNRYWDQKTKEVLIDKLLAYEKEKIVPIRIKKNS